MIIKLSIWGRILKWFGFVPMQQHSKLVNASFHEHRELRKWKHSGGQIQRVLKRGDLQHYQKLQLIRDIVDWAEGTETGYVDTCLDMRLD